MSAHEVDSFARAIHLTFFPVSTFRLTRRTINMAASDKSSWSQNSRKEGAPGRHAGRVKALRNGMFRNMALLNTYYILPLTLLRASRVTGKILRKLRSHETQRLHFCTDITLPRHNRQKFRYSARCTWLGMRTFPLSPRSDCSPPLHCLSPQVRDAYAIICSGTAGVHISSGKR